MYISKPFNSLAELQKLHNSYFEVCTHVFLSCQNCGNEFTEWIELFLFHFLVHTQSTKHSLFLAYCWVKKNWKEEEQWVALFFPFLQCHHFWHNNWLIEESSMSKRRYSRFFSHPCFLHHHCLLPALEASSGSNGKDGLSLLSASPLAPSKT